MSVTTMSVKPNRYRPIDVGPQPAPSSMPRLLLKLRSSAYGLLAAEEEEEELRRCQRSANLTRTREQGHTEVPTCMELLSW